MDLRRVRYFCAVAEEEHLTRAADRLGIRATSLSQQIIALERELGSSLFVRTSSGMAPTAAGRALMPHARRMLDAADQAVRAVREAGADDYLRIGVTPGAPPTLASALRAAGNVEMRDLPVARQLELLHSRGLDAGLIVLPEDVDGLHLVIVSDVALGVLVADAHPLAARADLEWPDLDGQDLLLFDRALAPGYHDALLSTCAAAGWRPNRIRVGPPRHALFVAELLHGDAVIALRPHWDLREGDGLRWLPIRKSAPRVRHALTWSSSNDVSQRLRRIATGLADEETPHQRPRLPRGQASD